MFWRRRKRLDEEIEYHLAEETADNIARGLDPVSARNEALRTFGNVAAAKEKAREFDPLYWLDTISQDFSFALRLLFRNRWTSLTIIVTLTVGIALNVSVFSLMNGLLLRPWVQSDPQSFVALHPRFSGNYQLRYSDGGMSQPDYVRYRDTAKSMQSLAAYRILSVTLSGPESGSIRAGLITCNMFDVLGTRPPLLGRYLRSDECSTPMQAAVVVLSEDFWRARFHADPGIVGRVVHLNRVPFLVVGVSPTFTLPRPQSVHDVSVPYSMLGSLRPADDYFADSRAQWLSVIGRRAPGYTLTQAQEELGILARRADEEVPGRTTSLIVTDGSLAQDPEIRERAPMMLAVTLGTTTLLLLLACVNVTTLLLARSSARQREIAVRLSLGAGRFRLLRQLLTESLLLSCIAAGLSLGIAQSAPEALWNSLAMGPAPFNLQPDARVLLYCVAVAVGTGVVAGLSPAAEALRPEVAESLKGSSTAVTGGRRRTALRSLLVATQVTLSLLLLVHAALFMRAQRQYLSYDPGFETKQAISVSFASVSAGFQPPPAFYEAVQLRIQSLPGITRTSFVHVAPWAGRNSTELSEIDGSSVAATHDFRRDPSRRLVEPEFFEVVSIRLTRGRVFRRNEGGATTPAVISEAMARRYWPDQDPVGHTFRAGSVYQVVGTCKDVQSIRFMREDGALYYAPLEVAASKPPAMIVRTAGDPQSAVTAIRSVVREIDPQMAVSAATLGSMIEEQGRSLQPVLLYGGFAGGLALLLALTGVYGVVSLSVSQRLPEIGIRLALGAQRRDVLRLVLQSGLVPVGAGLVTGVGLAVTISKWIESLLFGFNPRDPLTLIAVPVLLLLAATCAIWIPARRAAALDPLKSLRYE